MNNLFNKELVLREIISQLSTNLKYRKSTYEKLLKYQRAYQDLKMKISLSATPLIRDMEKNHKSLSYETIIKFLDENKYPEKYDEEITNIIKTTHNTIDSAKVELPRFNVLEIKGISVGLYHDLNSLHLVDNRWYSFLPYVKQLTTILPYNKD